MHFNPYIPLWEDMHAPLRPCATSIQGYKSLFEQVRPADRDAHVLLLGVTPELACADWLRPARITAIDHSADMISHIWPGDAQHRHAVLGDWLALPVAPQSQDIVVGDGVLNFFSFPEGHQQLAISLSSALRDSGHLIIRAFCAHEHCASPEEIFQNARRGGMTNFNEFKLLLLAALQQGQVHQGVKLATVWELFQQEFPDLQTCAEQTGWSTRVIKTIDLYKNNPAHYHLGTPREIEAAVSGQFKLVKMQLPSTPWSSPTPLMCFQKI
jgi:hypothetical protein